MAVACGFEESNGVLSKPEDLTHDQCDALQVWRGEADDGLPYVISCWKLTKEELEEVNKTGRIWLYIIGGTMPPASVGGKYPWSE